MTVVESALEAASPSAAVTGEHEKSAVADEPGSQQPRKAQPSSQYRSTTNTDFSARSLAMERGGLLTMQELLRRNDDLRKPVKPQVDDEDFVMTNTIKKEAEGCQAEKVCICVI